MKGSTSRASGLSLAKIVIVHAIARILVVASTAGAVSHTIDGSRQFQIIDGFGVNANSGSWNSGELRPALDMLVDQLGATIWRVIIDNADWEATTDNADPNIGDILGHLGQAPAAILVWDAYDSYSN